MFRSLTTIAVLFWIVNLVCHCDGEIHRVKSVYSSPGTGALHRTVVATDIKQQNTDDDVSHSADATLHSDTPVTSKENSAMCEEDTSSILLAAASQLKLLLSFAVGSLLGDVFLHLLPEAWLHVNDENDRRMIGLWVMAGILTFLIIEKLCSEEQPAGAHDKDDELSSKAIEKCPKKSLTNGVVHRTRNGKTHENSKISEKESHQKISKKKHNSENKSPHIHIRGYLNLAANIIDNFTHGLALAGSYLISIKVGLLTTFAILVHEIPHEVGDFAILLRSGFDRWKAAKAQLATASGGILGALTALTASSAEVAGNSTAWILPFTSGGFLYIALVTVTPDLLKERNHKESFKQVFGVCTGIGIMGLVTLLCD
ncbi:zinc transporter ZIP13-like isoform X2 [Tubulanus polymorphus]|uniref:zinc transporter ZIP13-like isoform X2 n=1 Tax=Tubulanus polymorphus TaxID=672921 RepID=UPI003DA2FBD5